MRLHRIDGADAVAPRMIGEHAMTQHIDQHALGSIGSNIAKAMVVGLLVLEAKLLEVVEKEACEQADAEAKFEDEDVVFQRAVFVRFDQRRVEHLGRIARKRAIIVNYEGDGRRIADERLVATLAQVLLTEQPFERFSQRHEILDDLASRLGVGQDLLSKGRRCVD